MTALFTELGLSEPILKAVAQLGFEQASPIQAAAIPILLSGRDVVGQSQTGSGKTAAFAIPTLERIDESSRSVQALVLAPTRELAQQVAEEFSKLTAFKRKIHAVPIYGGASYERQFSELRKGPQVVIGTPGRVMDHMDRRTLDLSNVKIVVLDECDRMLDMGFRDDIEKVLSTMPRERQTVLFSATLPPPIKSLVSRFTNNAEHVQIKSQTLTVPQIEQIYYDINPRAKMDALTRLIDMEDVRLGIIFCNTQRTVDEVADALTARGYAADRLHGGLSQMQRSRTLEKFKASAFDLLVATDVAGRGIDVDALDLVINFDLPYDPEDYVHRIGRTGRAGRKGLAFTFVSGREIYRLQGIERLIKQRLRRGRVPSLAEVEERQVSVVLDTVRQRLEKADFNHSEALIERLLDEGHPVTSVAAAVLQELLSARGLTTASPRQSEGSAPSKAETTAPAEKTSKPPRTTKAQAPAPQAEPTAAEEEPVEPTDTTTITTNHVSETQDKRRFVEEAPVTKPSRTDKREKPPVAGDYQQQPGSATSRAESFSRRAEADVAEPHSRQSLPPPARGFRWIRLNAGKADGLAPREIVDAITDSGDIDPKAVGLIKLHDHETFAQVASTVAAEIAEALDGADYEGKMLEVSVVGKAAPESSSRTPSKARPDRFQESSRRGKSGPNSYEKGPRKGKPAGPRGRSRY